MQRILYILTLLFSIWANAQTNMLFTNSLVNDVIKGNYNPAVYRNNLPEAENSKEKIIGALLSEPNNDSLLQTLISLASFYNRNTGSDTISEATGIGAARRWAHAKFNQYSKANLNRLLVSYFQFDLSICSVNQHRNILAVLPGTDTSLKDIVLVEAHIDSRCESSCDTSCMANGVEDNASGTALVLELARVMSRFEFKRTLVFMLTIGEEQGLNGADAFAKYCKQNGIKIRAVLNNDISGGIICGATSSPPSCGGLNQIDSMSVRIFSNGSNYSQHKGLARFIKLSYVEEIVPKTPVAHTINIMNAEDRTGRGGDHIPFRLQGYTSVRLTASHEHGDANPLPGYTDRQHSTRDILGVDTNNDGKLDSLFVDLNYLKRNLVINGNAMAMAANGPANPSFDLINDGNGLNVVFKPADNSIKRYVAGFRTRGNDFDTLIYWNTNDGFQLKTYHVEVDSFYFVSVAAIDDNNVESIFAEEKFAKISSKPATGINNKNSVVQLFTGFPNPSDETLHLMANVPVSAFGSTLTLKIVNMQGKEIYDLSQRVKQEMVSFLLEHKGIAAGVYFANLYLNNKLAATTKVVLK